MQFFDYVKQYGGFVLFLVIWMALCVALVTGLERILKAMGVKLTPAWAPHPVMAKEDEESI